jgi:hypothetical protein
VSWLGEHVERGDYSGLLSDHVRNVLIKLLGRVRIAYSHF